MKIIGRQMLSPNACKISTELAAVQSLMPIAPDDRQALRESIERDGIRESLRGYFSSDGNFQVLSGLNRLEIAKELGLPLVPVEVLEIAEPEREALAIDENRARRQLTLEDKRRLAAWLLKRNPQASDREIGKRAGLSKNTAAAVRSDLERRGQIDHVETRIDSKGRKQAAKRRVERRGQIDHVETPGRNDQKSEPATKSLSERTGSPQTRFEEQGKGAGRAERAKVALQGFNRHLEAALRTVELEDAQTLKVAVGHARNWLKELERKAKSAKA
jgi:ParB-like chromosome segregation protein Spo0J